MKIGLRRASRRLGLKPGAVVYTGDERAEPVRFGIIDYNDTELNEVQVKDVDACLPFRDSSNLSWINVIGVHDAPVIEKIGNHFEIHPLAQEDIVSTGQRPKTEEGGHYVQVVIRMLYGNGEDDEIKSEQVSVIWGKRWVLTFQETEDDVFDHVRRRLKQTIPRTRFTHPDYLAYALIDAIVDHYFVILESIGNEIEELEDEISDRPSPENLETIRRLKKQVILVRKAVWPLREAIGGLERIESGLVSKLTRPFLRDLYEHVIQVIDTVETFRELVSGLLDLYHTGVSNRMNEVMKVLTIFATIFIPLGFLAGVYGMNFDTSISSYNLPELGLPYGYLLFWGLVVIVAGGLLWFFRRRRWL